jgi:L-fuconolactonase
LFEVAAELGLNFNIYTRSTQVRHIGLLAAAFPQVKISLDHLGICPSTPMSVDSWQRPRFDQETLPPASYPQVMELAQYPNVYIKVSGEYAFAKTPYPYPDMKSMVEQVYQHFGAERMMWCSDFPWIVQMPGYGKLTALLEQHLPELTAVEKALIMGGNALRVWFNN